MKKILITLYLLLAISLTVKSQWYYAGESGVFTGKANVCNYNLAKTETLNYSGLFFNMPIGIKNDYNVLFEGSAGYNGLATASANVGYQLGYDYLFNLQVLAGVADYIEVKRHLELGHNGYYNAIGRFNIGHFFISGKYVLPFRKKYNEEAMYLGVGFKAYIYE